MNFDNLCITKDKTVIDALTQMDDCDVKLLLVMQESKFCGLLSIGDIQRAILKKASYDTKISEIMRSTFKVCNIHQHMDEIKKLMLDNRTEFMPILNDKGEVDRVVFWSELSQTTPYNHSDLLANVPVIIMAGGFGTRLKPLTNIIPKPLIPVGDLPIVHEIMNSFSNFGAKEFILSVNYKAESIKQYFDEAKHDFNVSYVTEDKPLGTTGSLYLLKDRIKQTFFVSNCDILIDQDYSEVLKYHQQNKNVITVVAALKHYKVPYGVIESGDDGLITSLVEKPDIINKINTGVYVLEPSVLKYLNEGEFMHITTLIEKCIANGERVGVYPISEKSYRDMGDWDEYLKFIRKEAH